MAGVGNAGEGHPAHDPVQLARKVSVLLAGNAPEVDCAASFPTESVAALHRAGLLNAACEKEYGGLGCTLEDLVQIGIELGRGCGSTAMTWAMHQVQIACLARHGGTGVRERLASIVADGTLVASVTSERGIGGSLRTSTAAIMPDGDLVRLEKHAPTVSYARHAGAFLVTARRAPDASPGDQIALYVDAEQASLVPAGSAWNPMGMRGTCSPGFTFAATAPATQVLPVNFGEIADATMVPLSHLLWAACWTGIAADAFRRAQSVVRQRTRNDESHTEPRLASASSALTQTRALLTEAIGRYRPIWADPTALGAHGGPALTVLLNNVKILASTLTVEVAQLSLEICGMAGYSEDGPLSVARHLRDLYSARLMIGNERLLSTNARLSLLQRN
ncbi:MAG TPA: acyl-CoA dehydrogenase family protein [Actinoplanes sp.]|nr:acyl-CoA dehydrogenase family protein [Actinoplanes sp.]